MIAVRQMIQRLSATGALSNTSLDLLIFSSIFFLTLGVVFGSFLNVVIDRFATNRSIIKGRSYCEFCKKTLEVRDLIPLLSFIFLKGRCRFCKKRIPLRLFLVELLTGVLSIVLFTLYGTYSMPFFMIIYLITLLFIAIFFIDLEYGIIPDKLTILVTIFSFIFLFLPGVNIFNHAVSGISSLIFFIGLFLITKGKGMGLGDVKLSLSIGLLLGYPLIIYGLYMAFLTGAIVSIILVLWRKKKLRGGTVPFGPFLTASTLFTLFLGEKVITPLVKLLF